MIIFLRRLAHYAVYLLAGAVIALSIIALSLRFLIMPDIGRYKADIEVGASQAVGMPVRIGEIQANWSHLNPQFSLRNLTLAPAGQPAPLQLNRVDATLSWLSLIFLEPHLANLDIHQPTLEIRRNKAGVILVAGIPVNTGGASSPFPDWLLRQRSVTVSDGKVIWIDEILNAPPLNLEHVNMGLASRFSHHSFGLTAAPPVSAARRIDIRGDLHGHSVHDLHTWHGQLYLQADDISATALNTWSPWAQTSVIRSLGNIRFWADLDQGQIQSVTGDVGLANVAVSLAEGLPDMAFARISGRLGWSRKGNEQTYSVLGLHFVTPSGQTAEPANVKVSFTPTPAGKVESAQIVADSLRLEALTALSGAVPLPRQTHDWLAAVNPHGFIEHIDLNWLGKDRFRLKTRFHDAGMNPTHTLPGLSGLNGEIETDEHTGQARLDSQGLHIIYSKVFRQPLDLSRLSTELRWSGSNAGGYRFDLVHCDLGNPDLDGSVKGKLTLPPRGAPAIDIEGRLTRGNGDAVWRYLPYQVADDAYRWLKQSIVGGTSPETTVTLRGSLDHFPFDKGGGVFQVAVRMQNGVLHYAPDWPGITGINGWLIFRDKGMTINAESGEILGTHLSSVQGIIPDLFYTKDNVLTLTGAANGPTAAFLDFIQQSPVNEYMGHFTDDMKASGSGSLRIKLTLPLSNINNSQVAGRFTVTGNDLTLNEEYPPLTNVNGSFAFTNTGVRAEGLSANLFGQPIAITLASEKGGRIHAGATGNLTATTLAKWLPDTLDKRVTGSTPVQADIVLRQHAVTLKLNSRLTGLGIDLPAPLGKPADQDQPFTLTMLDRGSGQSPLTFQYGTILSGTLAPDTNPEHTRLAIMFGGPPPALPKDGGITVQGTLHGLDFDTWRKLDLGGTSGGPPIRSINLTFNELQVFDRLLHNINVQARPEQRAWKLSLNGQEMQGEALYGPQPGTPGNSLIGQFKKFDIPRAASEPAASTAQGSINPDDLPKEVDLTIQSLAYNKHDLGELALKLTTAHDGLAISTFTLKTPETVLETSGWLSASPLRTTRLNVKLNSGNLGQLMRRMGYNEDIKGGVLDVQGALNWPGRAENFSKDKLGGSLKVELKNGRFIHLDPGAGKLLGILSLQALPRRITLDFRDIFSEGLAFDSIQGDVMLDRGIGYLPDLSIQSPAAKIHMKGKIDLSRENQELRLHIQPRLDEGVAVAGALLGGPAVAVGALVATKILKDPFSQAASFEYMVTGTWGDPIVTKLARPVAENAPGRP
ncbi:MAG: YhdP family protein [Parasulfuritortus sp.]|nr:YhdP family protein [Parasulfuritortus sp.]